MFIWIGRYDRTAESNGQGFPRSFCITIIGWETGDIWLNKKQLFINHAKRRPMSDFRKLILKESYRLFLYGNMEKVTFTEIEKATGKVRSSIAYYFRDKQSIFDAVVNEIFFPSFKIPKEMISCSDVLSLSEFLEKYKTPEERLIERTNNMLQISDAEKRYYDFLSQAGKYYPGFKQRYSEVINNEFVFLRNFMVNGNIEKIPSDYTEEELAHLVLILKTGMACIEGHTDKTLIMNKDTLLKKISSFLIQ